MPDERPTANNFFGTFLDVMNRPAQPTASHVAVSSVAAGPPQQTSAAPGGLDRLMAHLLAQDGRSKVSELLPLTDFSIDALMEAIGQLESLGMVIREGNAAIALTPAGRAVAEQQAATQKTA